MLFISFLKPLVRTIFVSSVLVLSAPGLTQAAALTNISDTISDSKPGVNANHAVQFTLANAVPFLGYIKIIPQGGYFEIPADLDYSDIDFLADGVNQSLTATNVGVISGTSGSITLTMDTAFPAGTIILLKVGTNAIFPITGDKQIKNPASSGSFRVRVETRNSSGEIIDFANTLIVILDGVSVGAETPAEESVPTPTPAPSPAPTGGGGGGGGSFLVTEKQFKIVDLNLDGRVDLIDLSILLFNWGRPKTNLKADINKDGLVDLVDFSILLFWWGK